MADKFRFFNDASLEGKTFDLQIQILKELQQDSVIIGVCGNRGIVDADPFEDGWFVSDFLAMRHILKGIGRQRWFITVDPESLVQRYREYVHGSRMGEKKVVLDEKILTNGDHTPETLEVANDVLDKFLGAIKEELSDENRQDRNLVLFAFGHGDMSDHSICIGGKKLQIETLASLLPHGCKVSFFTTACFSRGWAASPILDITTAYAARHESPSFSWPCGSSGFTGSPWVSAVIKALCECSEDTKQTSTYYRWSEMVRDNLKSLNKWVLDYSGMSFSARDDKWGSSWVQLLGVLIPNVFERNWAQLETRGAENDEASSSQPGGQERYQQGSVCSPQGFLNFLYKEVNDQLVSCPGSWTMGFGHSERARLRRFISNRNPTVSEMQSMWAWLSFRVANQVLAERLLQAVNVPPPLGCQNILSWDLFGREIDAEGSRLRGLHYNALFYANVMPTPAELEQGHFWPYALFYLAAALADHVDESEASRSIEIMAKGKSREVLIHGANLGLFGLN